MYQQIIIIGTFANYFISMFLSYRQLLALRRGKRNELLTDKIEDSDFETMKKYNTEKLIFSLFSGTISFIRLICFIHFHTIPKSYDYLKNISGIKSDMVLNVLFMLVFLHFERVMDIPLSLFSTFFIEERYGFNKMTFGIFLKDFLKETIVLTLIISPLYAGIYKIMNYFDTFFAIIFVFVCVFQIFLVMIYPVVIQPLFNKFKELEDGSLKTAIKNLAKNVGFKCSKIFVMDGSMRSNHSNAYFIGLFGERRIVLFDTLIKQATEDEIISILGHEIGHWYHYHIPKMLVLQFSTQFVFFYFLEVALKNKSFVVSLFQTENVPLIVKLVYFSFFMGILSPFLTLLTNMYSRYNERQADLFSIKLGLGENLGKGLISIHKENKSNVCPDWLYSTYYHSHPTLVERLEFISDEEKKLKEKEK
ncbi:Metalloprotease [Trachipleistophora hominis]|uniref:CAAX prenyl protease n=1 Tax=Trachipleistophora hominis TaxID=72359 RepID=L7K0J4_TRAHO|nr:Metalloprotease [Trachipleistophora hominis]